MKWIKRIIVFIVGGIAIVLLMNNFMQLLSNKYQKTICIEDFCIKKPKDWILELRKRKDNIYLYGLFPINKSQLDDFYLEGHSNGVILKKGLSRMIFYKYKGEQLFDERLTPEYKVDNKIYYMKKDNDSTLVIYPENKFVMYLEDYTFSLKLIEDIILDSTAKIPNKRKRKDDNKQNSFTKDILLGLDYYEGKKIPKDYEKAIFFFKKALKYENRIAYFFLGSMYEKGEGVEKNYPKAIRFYNKAAKQGYIPALYNLAIMYYYGRGVKKNYRKAISLLQKPIDYEFYGAYQMLGEMYQYGKGVRQNYVKALSFYDKAIKKNNFVALNNKAIMYFTGQGVDMNKKIACKYWDIARKKGEVHALQNVEKNCKD